MTVLLKLSSPNSKVKQFVALGPTEAKVKLQKNTEVNYDDAKILYYVKKVTSSSGNTIIECSQKQEL